MIVRMIVGVLRVVYCVIYYVQDEGVNACDVSIDRDYFDEVPRHVAFIAVAYDDQRFYCKGLSACMGDMDYSAYCEFMLTVGYRNTVFMVLSRLISLDLVTDPIRSDVYADIAIEDFDGCAMDVIYYGFVDDYCLGRTALAIYCVDFIFCGYVALYRFFLNRARFFGGLAKRIFPDSKCDLFAARMQRLQDTLIGGGYVEDDNFFDSFRLSMAYWCCVVYYVGRFGRCYQAAASDASTGLFYTSFEGGRAFFFIICVTEDRDAIFFRLEMDVFLYVVIATSVIGDFGLRDRVV